MPLQAIPTIPASDIAAVTPGVLAAGGSAVDIIALMLTTSTRVPTGTTLSFPNQISVADFFGATSDEAGAATVYFNGFDNSNVKPGSVLFAQYNETAVAAYLQGANIASLSLAQLQAIPSGNLTVVMDGYSRSASISLGAATSFSSGAGIIQTDLNAAITVQGSFTASIAGGTMTVTGVTSGTLGAGLTVNGTGVLAGTYITAQLSGAAGGTGTYSVNNAQNMSSSSLTGTPTPVAVTFDSVSGAYIITSGIVGAISSVGYASGSIGTALALTQVTGATLSQGAAAVATPQAFMNQILTLNQDFATFMTIFNPDVSGNTNKLAFSAWANGQNNRYMYVAWDNDASPTTQNPATSSLGYLVNTTYDYSGTAVVYSPDYTFAAFICGIAASIDFTQTNGRATFFGRSQTGLVANVNSLLVKSNLVANGYNFYGVWATATQQFTFLAEGTVSGPFNWIDSYINQIWLNANFQLDLMLLLTQSFSIPYNTAGDALIEAALLDTIQQAGNFGIYRAGIRLSTLQAAEINGAAGASIAPTLQNQGWYLSVKASTTAPSVRAVRGSPPCVFWYTDGQSVQKINLASINVQ
jgi:hypothetical protein